jgi:hypothetical protein
MLGTIGGWLSRQTRKKLSVLSTASRITLRPSTFAGDHRNGAGGSGVVAAGRFFLACVGIVLAIEAVFSLAFNTAFSDLVHHSFPVFVALLGGFTMHAFLKLLLTPNIRLAGTLESTLYVGGAALLFMIATIFLLLTVDFLASYQDIKTSPCTYRTIICLLSGGSLTQYDVPSHRSGVLGMSFPFVLLVMVGTVVYYSRVLAKALQTGWAVSPWRTYVAAALSVVLLTPVSLLAINAIYRLLYQ